MFGSRTIPSRSSSCNCPRFYLPSLDSGPSASRTPHAPATGMPKPGRNLPLSALPVTLVETTLTQPPVNVDSKQLIDNLSPLDATLTKKGRGTSSVRRPPPRTRKPSIPCATHRNARNSNPLMRLLHSSLFTDIFRPPPKILSSLRRPRWISPNIESPVSNFALSPTLQVQSPDSTQGAHFTREKR
jgi:hypothetical protein